MGLAEAVPATDQSNCLRVVHAHAAEDFSDLKRTDVRERLTEGSARVHVNEPNCGGAQRKRAVPLHGTGKFSLLNLRRSQLDAVGAVSIVLATTAEAKDRTYQHVEHHDNWP